MPSSRRDDAEFSDSDSGANRYLWPAIFGLGVIALFATRFDNGRSTEAMVLAAGIPLFAAWRGVAPLRDVATPLRLAAITVAVLVTAASETEVVHLFMPSPPLADVVLTPEQPDANLAIPDSVHELEVETHGKVAGANAEGEYGATLHRGSQATVLAGTFAGNVSNPRSRRSRLPVVTSRGPTEHVDRVLIDLPGTGAVHAHLDRLEGGLAQSLRVAVFRPPPGGKQLRFVFLALAMLALVVDALASLNGVKARLAAWIGFAAVIAVYLPAHFVSDDALTSVIGAIFAAVVAGWVVGWLLSYASARFASRFAEP